MVFALNIASKAVIMRSSDCLVQELSATPDSLKHGSRKLPARLAEGLQLPPSTLDRALESAMAALKESLSRAARTQLTGHPEVCS